LVCANDRLAIGALEALKKHGLKCPDDISVTGFNNLPYLRMAMPGLTTINIQKFHVGRASAELVLRSIDDPDAVIPSCTILPVQLIERGSVKPPAPAKH
jgi:LacI family transcriptional regulator